jgi:hypothetical protein
MTAEPHLNARQAVISLEHYDLWDPKHMAGCADGLVIGSGGQLCPTRVVKGGVVRIQGFHHPGEQQGKGAAGLSDSYRLVVSVQDQYVGIKS